MKNFLFLPLFSVAILVTTNIQAQSLKDIFNENVKKVVNAVAGKQHIEMVGSWTNTSSAIEFESDNLLKKAGGAVASVAAEKKLDEQLEKVGIRAGQLTFTFKADSTFSTKLGSKEMKGTYSYDATTHKVNLRFAKLIVIHTKMNYSSSEMDLLFKSDMLLKLIAFFSSKSSSASLKTVGALANGYDGMMLGFTLQKK